MLHALRGYHGCRISSLEALAEPTVVYNMEVATDECYAVAGGLVVHNCVDPLRYVGLVRPWGPGEPVSRRETSEEAETSRRWDERIKKLGAHTQEPNRPWKPQRMVPA